MTITGDVIGEAYLQRDEDGWIVIEAVYPDRMREQAGLPSYDDHAIRVILVVLDSK